ncbi:MAG: hypothetical protein IJ635_12335 [Bacteroidaceae bacterium]|nr:hypothetical protein [Bacteroidaceae bacterium]MBR1522004.1 hypothetical protein [Bacteroidaceae bacterium]
MKYAVKIIMGMLSAVAFTSCATIVSGSKATVLLDGDMPDTLTIQTNVTTYENVTLPQQVEVKRKHLKEPIVVSKDATTVAEVYPGRKIVPCFWVNLVTLPSVVGLVVDGVTGSMYEPTHHVRLQKDTESRFAVQNLPWVRKPIGLYRHEVSFGLGVPSLVSKSRMDEMENVVQQRLGYQSGTQSMYLGAVSGGFRYFYHIDKHWAVGVQMGHIGDYSAFSKQDARGNWQDADILMSSPFLMAAAKYYWYATDALSFYSKAGIGAMRRHLYFHTYDDPTDDRFFNEKKWLPAYQFSPIGIELGRRNLRFFTELGYGTDGVVNFGITYHFKRVK